MNSTGTCTMMSTLIRAFFHLYCSYCESYKGNEELPLESTVVPLNKTTNYSYLTPTLELSNTGTVLPIFFISHTHS